jgi:hypothetical protein
MKTLHFPEEARRNAGFFFCQNISLLLTFSLPQVKRKEINKTQKQIIEAQKMDVTQELT